MAGHLDLALPGRGKTLYRINETPNASSLRGLEYEGWEQWFPDINPITGLVRSPRRVLCRFVRNVSGISLLPKRAVSLQLGQNGTRVDGYSYLTAGPGLYLVDEYLPAAGVQNNDCFWMPIYGPALATTSAAGTAANLIASGGFLVGETNAASTAATAGRLVPQDLTGATALLGAQILNTVGRAQSAMTTGQTGVDVLVNLMARW